MQKNLYLPGCTQSYEAFFQWNTHVLCIVSGKLEIGCKVAETRRIGTLERVKDFDCGMDGEKRNETTYARYITLPLTPLLDSFSALEAAGLGLLVAVEVSAWSWFAMVIARCRWRWV